MKNMKSIRVNASKSYTVHIGRGLIDRVTDFIPKKYGKFIIITDDNVGKFYLDRVTAAIPYGCWNIMFTHGEASKTLATIEYFYNYLSEAGIGRNDCIIALGGGVVGDMAGFAAATYLRGIDFVQIPTSLLAQVDSSVGGKTGVDLPRGKNLVGAFHQPVAVIIDIDTLDTLPQSYFKDGLGEVIKYGLIRSNEITELLLSHDTDSIKTVIDEIVYRCIDIKRQIVENDEFERGERKLLNFGHTFGHAIERLENFTGMSHGLAVVAGMKIVSAVTKNNDVVSLLDKISEKYDLTREVNFSFSELLEAAMTDKKRSGETIDVVVCKAPGESFVENISFENLRKMCE
ncbi:MAG: 3-dehydroquinate synthase [Ruminococcus sp.]|jgi:3-dehydroquinate synthase|nr:3-dehydroquinate synthase [Ruminococcus sp.]